MSNYRLGTQKTAKGHKVVLYSTANGKLILAGESLARSIDAVNMANELRDAFNNKRETMPMEPIEMFLAGHRWVRNAGPKKKVARGHVSSYVDGSGFVKVPRKALADADFLRKKSTKKK